MLIFVFAQLGRVFENFILRPFVGLCDPCTLQYHFIGKFESLIEDGEQVLLEVGVSNRITFPVNLTGYRIPSEKLVSDYFATVDDKTFDELYKIYESDFVAIGYEKADIRFNYTLRIFEMADILVHSPKVNKGNQRVWKDKLGQKAHNT